MNLENLSRVAAFLDQVKPEEFCHSPWVALPEGFKLSGFVDDLPAGSKACVVGWLPRYAPEEWCWFSVKTASEIYPVCRSSSLWSGEKPEDVRKNSSTEEWVLWYVWRQVGEWLQCSNSWLLQFMFCGASYATGDSTSSADMRNRILVVMSRLKNTTDWENKFPNSPTSLWAFAEAEGFSNLPCVKYSTR